MRTINLSILLSLALASPSQAKSHEQFIEEVLWAIRQVESGDRWDRRGPMGELGAYQFRREVWQEFSPLGFNPWARNREHAHSTAIRKAQWIIAYYDRHGFPVSSYTVGLAWHAGAPTVVNRSRRLRDSQVDYAKRVRALVESLNR